MALDAIGSGKALSSSGAASNRFVVLPAGIAKAEVVHRALGGRHHAHGPKQQVAEGLGGFDIARHHRGRRLGIEQAPARHHQIQGFKTAGIERNRLRHQGAKGVEHRRLGDRQRRMEVVAALS